MAHSSPLRLVPELKGEGSFPNRFDVASQNCSSLCEARSWCGSSMKYSTFSGWINHTTVFPTTIAAESVVVRASTRASGRAHRVVGRWSRSQTGGCNACQAGGRTPKNTHGIGSQLDAAVLLDAIVKRLKTSRRETVRP